MEKQSFDRASENPRTAKAEGKSFSLGNILKSKFKEVSEATVQERAVATEKVFAEAARNSNRDSDGASIGVYSRDGQQVSLELGNYYGKNKHTLKIDVGPEGQMSGSISDATGQVVDHVSFLAHTVDEVNHQVFIAVERLAKHADK